MRKRPRRSVLFYVYVVSIGLHGALALGAALLPKPKRTETIAIQLAEAKKKKEPPKPPPPPPEPAKEKPKPRPVAAQPVQAKVAPVAKAEAPPPGPGGDEGFVSTGISLGNADGPGVAVPMAVAAAAAPRATATATHKVRELAAPTQGADVCNAPVVKPKRKSLVTPKYTLEARQADIEGIIRVEVTVDETGHVASARILSGLGYGLDEAALAAARQCTFEPATQCGKPIVGTAVLPFRMELD